MSFIKFNLVTFITQGIERFTDNSSCNIQAKGIYAVILSSALAVQSG
ncbi:hypothetical protein [Candidatus Tisiphia endosymbiont of Ceraclea dissimilis]